MKQLTEPEVGFGVALAVGEAEKVGDPVGSWVACLVGDGDFFGSFRRYWLLAGSISTPLRTRRVGLELEHPQLVSVEQDPVLSEHCPG